jgi:hypothetical protein
MTIECTNQFGQCNAIAASPRWSVREARKKAHAGALKSPGRPKETNNRMSPDSPIPTIIHAQWQATDFARGSCLHSGHSNPITAHYTGWRPKGCPSAQHSGPPSANTRRFAAG